MKLQYKKQNSPRRDNAIRQAYNILADSSGWFGRSHFSDDLGELIWSLKFKADKYDVINALVLAPGNNFKPMEFIRADIRPHRRIFGITDLLILVMLIVALLMEWI